MANKQAIAFFYEWAGYAYDPAKETPTQGRMRGARILASAESWAHRSGCSFEWQLDGMDSSEWDDDPDPWATWQCLCHDAQGKVLASLCGIDFGRDGEPWSNNYRRVVEAELSLEARHYPD